MIEFSNVTFAYKGKKENVLENFSLSVKKGERLHLSAPSGKGKTTVLRLITGLERAKKGEVSIRENAKISVVFQEDRLIPSQTVFKNVSLFSGDEKAKELLSKLGLWQVKDSYPNELSGGMKRRLALARALSKNFDILLLDEAFNGLDEENLIKAVKVVEEYLKDKTLILISHSDKEAQLLKAKTVYL